MRIKELSISIFLCITVYLMVREYILLDIGNDRLRTVYENEVGIIKIHQMNSAITTSVTRTRIKHSNSNDNSGSVSNNNSNNSIVGVVVSRTVTSDGNLIMKSITKTPKEYDQMLMSKNENTNINNRQSEGISMRNPNEIRHIDTDGSVIGYHETNKRAKPVVCVIHSNSQQFQLFSDVVNKMPSAFFHYESDSNYCDRAWPTVRYYTIPKLIDYDLSRLDRYDMTIVSDDNYCMLPTNISTHRSIHSRHYYSTHISEATDWITITTMKFLKSNIYLPLGPREGFQLPELEYAFSRTYKNKSERDILFNLFDQGGGSFVSKLLDSKDYGEVLKNIGNKYVQNFWKNRTNTMRMPHYQDILLRSAFTVCPRQDRNSDVRCIFEASASGSIPIVSIDEIVGNVKCHDQLAPFLDTGAPFMILLAWKDLPDALADITLEKILNMQRNLKIWFKKFWRENIRMFECGLVHRLLLRKPRTLRDFGKFKLNLCNATSILSLSTSKLQKRKTLKDEYPPLPMKYPYSLPLITGCARSGSLTVASFLKSLGVKTAHENFIEDSVAVSWLYGALDFETDIYVPFEKTSGMVLRESRKELLKANNMKLFDPVIHMVRDPIRVISSTRRCFCGKGSRRTAAERKAELRAWTFVEHFIPQLANYPYNSTERSMMYWLEWNRLIEKRYPNALRLKLEDPKPEELLDALNLTSYFNISDLPTEYSPAISHVSRFKERGMKDATWEELFQANFSLAEQVKEMATRYGYEL